MKKHLRLIADNKPRALLLASLLTIPLTPSFLHGDLLPKEVQAQASFEMPELQKKDKSSDNFFTVDDSKSSVNTGDLLKQLTGITKNQSVMAKEKKDDHVHIQEQIDEVDENVKRILAILTNNSGTAKGSAPVKKSSSSIKTTATQKTTSVKSNAASRSESSIKSIDISGDGSNATITFNVDSTSAPKTRLINEGKNWVAIDIYDTIPASSLPASNGLVSKIKQGKHDGFQRYVVYTQYGISLKANKSATSGKVTLNLTKGSRYASQAASTPTRAAKPAPKKQAQQAPVSPEEAWDIRAINKRSAVLVNRETGQMLSIREGSKIPDLGIVTAFDPGNRKVHTTKGSIAK